ncbi:MAG: ATP synthase F1 subunit delta, partial [Clostridia bacterium]|nr:ATP synthase F1 subunit delta [Clostridia bacterium]
DAFGGVIEEKVLWFACLLCEKGRIREIYECRKSYEDFYLASKNIERAKVISASQLRDEEKQKLCDRLEKKFGKKFEIEYSVDGSLLGGAVIKTDGAVFDGSLKRRLKDAKEVMQG